MNENCPFTSHYRRCNSNCGVYDSARKQCSFISIAQGASPIITPTSNSFIPEMIAVDTCNTICKTCDYCHWMLDAAGAETEYRCIRDIYPKLVDKYDRCDCWRPKTILN